MNQPVASTDAVDAKAPTSPEAGAFVIVRHGQTDWSASGRHTGVTDVPLTPEGERQAASLRGALTQFDFGYTSASPRQRAWRTADLAGAVDPQIDPDLAEWDYGTYEGMTREEIRRARPDWTIWTGTPIGGESAEEVETRARRVVSRLLPTLHSGKDAIVFTHGHFSRVLTTVWLALPTAAGVHFLLDPATVSILTEDRGDRVVVRWNSPPTEGGPATA